LSNPEVAPRRISGGRLPTTAPTTAQTTAAANQGTKRALTHVVTCERREDNTATAFLLSGRNRRGAARRKQGRGVTPPAHVCADFLRRAARASQPCDPHHALFALGFGDIYGGQSEKMM
jgi:hypothetical protein